MPGEKKININFELVENKINKKDLIEKLYTIVKDLIKENKIIKDELKNKCQELDKVKNEINYLKNENREIKNIIKMLEENIKSIKENFYDLDKSYIVKNEEEKRKLKEWISDNGIIKKINLIYRATNDGDDKESFYNKCRNKGATISLIKTKKGKRFGDFLKQNRLIKKEI